MIRYGLNPIIFLINNGGYTIEVEIHDGPYNNIQGWDYSGLVQCFDNHQGNVFSTKVRLKQPSFCLFARVKSMVRFVQLGKQRAVAGLE